MPTKKYYAVHKGRICGVFTDWSITKESVNKFQGAVYKSFSTFDEAEYFHRNGPCSDIDPSNKNLHKIKGINFSISMKTKNQGGNWLMIYTDGSCFKVNGEKRAGYGYVVLDSHNNMKTCKGRVPGEKATNQVAELYAIYMALKNNLNKNIKIYTDSMYSIKIFTKWIQGWKRNGWITSKEEPVENSELIKLIEPLLNHEGRVVKFEHVRAHRGNTLNELADSLAKQGVESI